MNVARFHENVQRVLAMIPPPPRPEAVARTRPESPDPGPVVVAPTPEVSPPVPAGPQVQWRYDYNLARREAEEKSKPLVLDFSTKDCLWCKKLEATTFRDGAVVGTMNDEFIPLKLDGDRETALTQSLRILKYPTVVLAAPDGRILGTFEGYLEAARFHEYLQRALASVTNPEWMLRDYQAAAKAMNNADYARAVALLKSITEDGNDRPVQVKARQLLRDLEQQAYGRLARAKQLDNKGQTTEAMETITELLRMFAGTQAASEASQTLRELADRPEVRTQQRTVRARELLAQAREDYRTQQYLCCLDRCEVLAANYGDLPEGIEAVQMGAEIKNNPEWMRKACDDLSDRLSMLLLARAETCLVKGQQAEAVRCLERVIQGFPGSRQAETAQIRLSQIEGKPTLQAEFKKP
jgi:TolA-binding protein